MSHPDLATLYNNLKKELMLFRQSSKTTEMLKNTLNTKEKQHIYTLVRGWY